MKSNIRIKEQVQEEILDQNSEIDYTKVEKDKLLKGQITGEHMQNEQGE